MSCACGDSWRFEVADLATGLVRAVIHPVSANWETVLNSVGRGTLTLPTKDVRPRDIWPHLSSVYILRTSGGNASLNNPVVEFGGLIESFSASDSGTTQVGLKSIEQYLFHRHLGMNGAPGPMFIAETQTQIGKKLVDHARPNGIPLFSLADRSTYPRFRNYEGYERKNIGEAIQELTQVAFGCDYEITHSRRDGRWSSTMIFRDYVGVDRHVQLRSSWELGGYGLDVDASDHTTYVDAIGSGEEKAQLTAHAEDRQPIYPRFDSAPAWKDVSVKSTLQDHADGHLATFRDPVAVPSATVIGMDPDPATIRNGDTVNLDINYGAVSYRGDARVVSTAWNLSTDGPPSRTFDFTPLTRSSRSVLNQEPRDDECEDC